MPRRTPESTLADLSPGAMAVWFDDGTIARGIGYAAGGRVLGFEVDGDDTVVTVVGIVEGSTHDYEVEVLVVRKSQWAIYGDCTCPVGDNCKHAVALLLAATPAPGSGGATALQPAAPAWGRLLDDVLGSLERATVPEQLVKPLALQVELGRAVRYRQSAQPTVLLRPLVRGARENWIKSGASWRDATSMGHSHRHDPRQGAALAELATLRIHAHDYYGQDSTGSPAGSFGPGLWPVLREAQEAGVVLVPVAPLVGVTVAGSAATVGVDVVADESGARLVVGVDLDGRRWVDDKVVVLGARGHGVALLTPAPGRRGDEVELVLAPLDRPLPAELRRLLEQGESLRVPPADTPGFVRDYLPRLRRHVPVASSDGTVELPVDAAPELVLTVTWSGPGRLGLAWEWRYVVGDDERRFPLGSADGVRTVRRPRLEQELLAALDLDGPARDLLMGPDGVPITPQDLSNDDVLTFVAEVLPDLRAHPQVLVEEHGPTLDYRESAGDPEIRFELDEPDDDPDGGPIDRPTDWLNLSVMISVDGEQVPLAVVLEALTRGDTRIFLPSGLYLRADHPALARLAEAVASATELADGDDPALDLADPARPRLRVATTDLGLVNELTEIGSVDAQAAQWVRAAQALSTLTELPEVDLSGVTASLRPYQLEGVRWLAFLHDAGLGGILADDMGLGKTLQALCLISHARAAGAGPFLVVAPTSVVGGWVHEIARHTPGLTVRAVTASGRRRGTSAAEEWDGADVVVTSYTLLRLEAEQYADVAWGGLVLDEAHQVKNHRGKTYQAVRGLDVPFRVALTGTPFENRLSELWSLLSIVAPGLYPSSRKFVETVATPVEKRGDNRRLERFRLRIKPFVLRRTKDLVAADLPPKQENVLEVTLGPAHRKIYDTHLNRERQSILGLLDDFDNNRIAIFRALTRLRQLSLDVALVDDSLGHVGSAKLDALVDHVHQLAAEGHRALVFSQFTRFLGRVRERLTAEGVETVYLDGSTRDRPAVITEFRDGAAPVFLISLKAGGVGLTLTEADYVFVLDPWWNPAVEAQAVDRVHRIGQTRSVMVYRLVATDTIEEKVMELKARKAALFDQVIDGDGALASAVTADDIRAMFGGSSE